MPITRAGIEGELVAKLRGTLANRFYTLSVLTSGSNPDLNGPIRRAVLALGGSVAAPDGLTVADADLAPFEGWDVEKLLDWARLETLQTCLAQCLACDVKTGEDEQMLSQLSSQLLREIAAVEARLNKPYGPSIRPAVVAAMGGSPGMPNDPFLPCSTRSPCGRWPYP